MKWLSLFLLPLIVACTACTSNPPDNPPLNNVGCSIEQSITSAFAAGVQQALTCTNLKAIQADIQASLGKADLCAKVPAPQKSKGKKGQPSKGFVGMIVCPAAVDSAMGLVLTQVPLTWECLPSKDPGSLKAALAAACLNVIPY